VTRRGPSTGIRLAGIEELLVDGNNLLHRTAGRADPSARHELLARLRAALPPGLRAVVVLDGPPDPGAPLAQRVSAQLEVRHSGRRDADDLIVTLLGDRPAGSRARVVVVSDDRALRDRVARLGVTAYRLDWLTELLPRPRPPVRPNDDHGDPDREPWAPGRGATTKRGNPRRSGRHGAGGHPPPEQGRTV